MNKNLEAFLTMISVSEGTYGLGDNGYNVLVGGELFSSYEDHPRKRVWIRSINNFSTAAGRYQILGWIYDYYKDLLNLKDFSPTSQDLIAIRLIKERLALKDIIDGKFESAVHKVRKVWASLPGAGYGQHENKLSKLIAAYKNAGGTIA